jgi:hypothetical protein
VSWIQAVLVIDSSHGLFSFYCLSHYCLLHAWYYNITISLTVLLSVTKTISITVLLVECLACHQSGHPIVILMLVVSLVLNVLDSNVSVPVVVRQSSWLKKHLPSCLLFLYYCCLDVTLDRNLMNSAYLAWTWGVSL